MVNNTIINIIKNLKSINIKKNIRNTLAKLEKN